MSGCSAQSFSYLVDLVKNNTGISLSSDKGYLIESRLLPLARTRGMSDIDALVAQLKSKVDSSLQSEVVEAMTTNETSFFRDSKPFTYFKQALPDIVKDVPIGQLRIWSAACSSGQEAYSLAMMLQEDASKWAGRSWEILGTDVCKRMVEKAKQGSFTQFEVQRGMPINLLMKYFNQEGDNWLISDDIKRMVKFQPGNLLEDVAVLGKFDIVFCRNVLIYFEDSTKKVILDKIASVLKPNGHLYLGGSETVRDLSSRFTLGPNYSGIYRLTS